MTLRSKVWLEELGHGVWGGGIPWRIYFVPDPAFIVSLVTNQHEPKISILPSTSCFSQ